MTEHLSRVAEVLIEHTRVSIERCHCGWSDLGRSHAEHVAQALDAAGLLAKYPHLELDGDWLIEVVNYHTCGAGPGSGAGHEPGCGTIPVGRLATPEPAPADDLPGEPVEPGDLRAGDRVGLTFMGERITCTLVSSPVGDALRSDTPDRDDYCPSVTLGGREWCPGIFDVRLIEPAPADVDPDEALARALKAEYGKAQWWLDVARAAREHIDRSSPVDATPLLEREREEQRERAEKAEAERDALRDERDSLRHVLGEERKIARAVESARDEWKAHYMALRADVERTRGINAGAELTFADEVIRGILDRDDERGRDA